MRFGVSPGVSGTIADEGSRLPLGSAEVAVSSANYSMTNMPTTPEGREELSRMPKTDREQFYRTHTVSPSLSNALAQVRPPVVLTGDDGRFSIPSRKRWGLYVVPMDIFPPQGTLVVKRDGYEPLMVWVWARDSTNLGSIFLKRATK
jgi:hypothetical protein